MKLNLKKTRSQAAFSRVELTAILAALALLSLTILPAIATSHRGDARMTCVNNLKRLLGGVGMFAAEHDDQLPWPNWDAPQDSSLPGWLYTAPIGLVNGTFRGADTGQLWQYLTSTNIFRCPLDTPERDRLAWLTRNANMSNGAGQNLSSYSMNGAVCGYSDVVGGITDGTYKQSAFRSDAWIFWECSNGPGSLYFNNGANFPSEGISDRHLTGAVVAAIGGDVLWIQSTDYSLELNVSPGRLWCNPGTPNGH